MWKEDFLKYWKYYPGIFLSGFSKTQNCVQVSIIDISAAFGPSPFPIREKGIPLTPIGKLRTIPITDEVNKIDTSPT
jgi:hypothetical protein